MTQKDTREDKEANHFARAILMPEKFIRKELEKQKKEKIRNTEDSIKLLANKFKVSVVQMTIRLTELKIII